jgi:hypothetical protein
MECGTARGNASVADAETHVLWGQAACWSGVRRRAPVRARMSEREIEREIELRTTP